MANTNLFGVEMSMYEYSLIPKSSVIERRATYRTLNKIKTKCISAIAKTIFKKSKITKFKKQADIKKYFRKGNNAHYNKLEAKFVTFPTLKLQLSHIQFSPSNRVGNPMPRIELMGSSQLASSVSYKNNHNIFLGKNKKGITKIWRRDGRKIRPALSQYSLAAVMNMPQPQKAVSIAINDYEKIWRQQAQGEIKKKLAKVATQEGRTRVF